MTKQTWIAVFREETDRMVITSIRREGGLPLSPDDAPAFVKAFFEVTHADDGEPVSEHISRAEDLYASLGSGYVSSVNEIGTTHLAVRAGIDVPPDTDGPAASLHYRL